MIYDSGTWKAELSKDLIGLKKFFEETDLNCDEEFEESQDTEIDERNMGDVAFIMLQKHAVYNSIIIRKLIEANKISDELLSKNFSIKSFKKIDNTEINFDNGYEIETLYDLESPLNYNISIKNLSHILIHSFHFIAKFDWQKIELDLPEEDVENWNNNGLLGFYFSSDKTKDLNLFYITFIQYCSIVQDVIDDFIVRIERVDGKITVKSNKSSYSKTEIEEFLKKKHNAK
jgi:hypothetical protein